MADCPNAFAHGNPFVYCECGWINPEDVVAETRRVEKRHPGTDHLLELFEYGHLPEHLQFVSAHFHAVAHQITRALGDGPELTAGLRKLLEAKDCMVRQAMIDHRNRES
ncbi:hypothetical protein [Rhodococcus ruber]|uniref:hypothetical protein n=1 Tax=Rhodococcus ruber TaxID=1830 RepID=UPI003D815153